MDSPNVPQAPGGRIRALGFRAIRRGARSRLPPSGRMTSSARWYEATFTTTPWLARGAGSDAWVVKNIPLRLTFSIASQVASSTSSTGVVRMTPALLTRTSRPPNPSSARATAWVQPATVARSPDAGWKPSPPSAAIAARTISSLRSLTATRAPAARNRPAVAWPNYSRGRRSAHGRAASSAAATRRTPASSKRRPTICRPTGKPAAVQPDGTESAGQ